VIEHHVADHENRASGRGVEECRQFSRRGGHWLQARWPSSASAPRRTGA
jgi:hypothetical protein